MEKRLSKIRAKEKAQRAQYLKGDHGHKKRRIDSQKGEDGDDEDQFVLDDYDSDADTTNRDQTNPGGLSAATRDLMEKLGIHTQGAVEEEAEVEDEIKVCYSISSLPKQS